MSPADPRVVQVRKLDTMEAFTDRFVELGLELPVDSHVDPGGPLSRPVTVLDGSAGAVEIPNRFAVLPMEGWDGTEDGRPTDLVRRRWKRFGESGCGLVWCEATAVRHDGRANPRQLVLDERTVDDIASLRTTLDDSQAAGLQLTHSGRFSRPDGASQPRTAYRHPLLDGKVGCGEAELLSDGELDALVDSFVTAATLAHEAGFDFVDIKHCHGYLLHELLTATTREGRYGGDFEGRTRFLRSVVSGIRDRSPGLAVAVRVSAFDFRPFEVGPDGIGEPVGNGAYPHAFGGDATGLGIDLTETHRFLDLLGELGIGLVSTTAGSPYYNPHIQRPAAFPPSDGYRPPEDPLVGVARQISATAELARAHPDLVIVGSGYTYLQEWLAHVGQAVVGSGGAAMVGLGRMVLSYPQLAADVLAGREPQRPLLCRTFSDCTTAPRSGLISGCYPIDPFYKSHPQRVDLTRAKKEAKARFDRGR